MAPRPSPPSLLLPPLVVLLPLLAAAVASTVWTEGGPGPPRIVGIRGEPLWLHCNATDPRSAANLQPKQTNPLGISNPKNYTQVLHDYDDSVQNADKNQKNVNSGKKKNTYYDEYDDQKIFNEDKDFLADDGYTFGKHAISKRKNDEMRRKSTTNKKLEKKMLDRELGKKGKYVENVVTYVWFHNDTEISINDSRRIVLENGTLYFKRFGGGKKIQRSGFQDIGQYRCLARSTFGATLSTSVELEYALLDQNFTMYPINKIVNEGDAFQVHCYIKSTPYADITWEKDAMPLVNNKRYYNLPLGTLLILNTQKEDSGIYRCIASNHRLNRTVQSPTANISVVASHLKSYNLEFVNANANDISYFESISNTNLSYVKNMHLDGLHGKDILLTCAVKGRPKPKVIWSFHPDFEIETNQKKEFNSMEILKLSSLNENSSGIYSCIATNGNQSISQEYHLRVIRPPIIKQRPMSEYTPTAKTVRFNCSADGYPSPKVTWYKDGKPLTITGRLKIKAAPRLIISDTISTDKGIYQCIASNILGEAEAWGALSVRAAQGVTPPTVVRCFPLGPQIIRVSWEAPNHLDVLAYTVHFFPADGGEEHSVIPNKSEILFTKDTIKPFERYEFYIKSYVKTRGASDQSKHVICHGQGVPIYIYSFKNNSALISWRKTARSVPNIKQWKLQWRKVMSDNITEEIFSNNVSTYLLNDISSVNDYEFRVLASISQDWLSQNLTEVQWTFGDKSISYNDQSFNLEVNKASNLYGLDYHEMDETDDHVRQFDEDFANWTLLNSLRPIEVNAYATSPRTVNISWKCNVTENNSNNYHFVICYSPHPMIIDKIYNIKYKETCMESLNNWKEIPGLEPNTLYSFRIQSVMQNWKKGGPFSEIITCRTKHDVTNSVVDVRWELMSDGVLNISWIPNSRKLFLKSHQNDSNTDFNIQMNEKEKNIRNSIIYTVYYSNNASTTITEWKSKNVTNTTHTLLKDLNTELPCYVMVSIVGEQRGPVIVIPPSKKDGGHIESNIIALIVCAVVSISGVVLCTIFWYSQKYKRSSSGIQSSQIRTNRIGNSDFECQELVSPSTHTDPKGGMLYMNGISSDVKEQDVGEPLLNGHVNITENPRFSSRKLLPNGNCKHVPAKKRYGPIFDGVLDVSRHDESSNITMETTLEDEVTPEGAVLSENDHNSQAILTEPVLNKLIDKSKLKNGKNPNMNNAGVLSSNLVTNNLALQVDRNSNSEISNINQARDPVSENQVFSDARLLSFINSNAEKNNCVCVDSNHKKNDGFKSNSLDIETTLDSKENGSLRCLAPALGPNG